MTTLYVGPSQSYKTISAAVAAAAPGDMILIDPGLYREQLVITTNDLAFCATVRCQTVLKAPAGMTGNKALFESQGATGLKVDGLVLAGPSPDYNSHGLEAGILVAGGGAVVATDCAISLVQDAGFPPVGPAAQSGLAGHVKQGSLTLTNCDLHEYQRGGLLAEGEASSLHVTRCGLKGFGPTGAISQFGVYVKDGAACVIDGLAIAGHRYTGSGAGHGVLLNGDGIKGVFNSAIADCDHGLRLINCSNATVERNAVSCCRLSGVTVDSASGGNAFRQNAGAGNAAAGGYDAEDFSAGAGAAGTANIWTGNRFGTDNKSGGLSQD